MTVALGRPPPPTTVALANGGGVGNAYINDANKANVSVSVGLPASSVSTNTVHVTITDGTNTTTDQSHGRHERRRHRDGDRHQRDKPERRLGDHPGARFQCLRQLRADDDVGDEGCRQALVERRGGGEHREPESTFVVPYTTTESGTNLDEVRLYVDGPAVGTNYVHEETDTDPSQSGESFSYDGATTNGTYNFYTRALDNAGNLEDAPTTPPDSSASRGAPTAPTVTAAVITKSEGRPTAPRVDRNQGKYYVYANVAAGTGSIASVTANTSSIGPASTSLAVCSADCTVVKAYGDVAEHDRVPAFVAHLDLLREAGDDPAVAEADARRRRRPRPHRAQGQGPRVPGRLPGGLRRAASSPCSARRDPLELPADLAAGGARAAATPHLHEERRLFYVAMTRAKDELVLTSAADYGTARAAQGLALRGGGARPALARAARRARAGPWRRWPATSRRPGAGAPASRPLPDSEIAAPVLPADRRLPDLPAQVQVRPPAARAAARPPPRRLRQRGAQGGAGALPRARRGPRRSPRTTWSPPSARPGSRRASSPASTRSSGWRAGEEALRRFHRAGGGAPLRAHRRGAGVRVLRGPHAGAGPLRPRGRGREARVTILDFKTGAVDDPRRRPSERAQESLQLDVYALAHLRTHGRLPDRVELRFLESGLAGGKRPTARRRPRPPRTAVREVVARASAAATSPRRPSYMACGQCAFRTSAPTPPRRTAEAL